MRRMIEAMLFGAAVYSVAFLAKPASYYFKTHGCIMTHIDPKADFRVIVGTCYLASLNDQ